ncbi:filensin [Genypterus blacodes]|uniref:filensin n=1 Tax=Genypterus blacodes TaxID=154954 RepID=UPI003F7673A6
MFRTSYLREVRKEKYERSDVFTEEPEDSESSAGMAAIQGWETLQDLNSRFARYINKARVLEQRNAVYRKQLETLQRMEEASGPEEAFKQQIESNRQRMRELAAEHVKLERELRDAGRMMDQFTSRYRDECEYQEQLRGTLENLNKEADAVLLRNLDYQIQSQFLQEDISSTRERNKKNLAEIQTYVHILQQINQPLAPNVSLGISEEQEKLLAQKELPSLKRQLEEHKSALCQLHDQKQRLQAETAVLEQTFKSSQENYDDELQMCNDKIESLRKEMEEAERSLEKCMSECRHLAMYQTSLENELERYTRIIQSEDSRLNSAIIGTPIALFTTNYRYTHVPSGSSRGRDITQDLKDITSIKPRQKIQSKKDLKKKETNERDAMDSGGNAEEVSDAVVEEEVVEERVERTQHKPASSHDVPDGAQISKAFDTLCNIVRDRMRRYKRPEAIADFYTKGRYVLVTGDGSYSDPCFYTSTPSAGHIIVTIRDGMMSPYQPYSPPQPFKDPRPLSPTLPSDDGGKGDNKGGKGKDNGGKGKHKHGDPHPKPKDPNPVPPTPAPGPKEPSPADHRPSSPPGPRGASSPSSPTSSNFPPGARSYEKMEMMESVEKFSNSGQAKAYEETSVVMETTIEKSSKKKN